MLESISEAMDEAGATKDDIDEALSKIDVEDLKEAIEIAAADGKDAIGAFVDSISDKIDFGSIDLEKVKNGMTEKLKEIDFSNAINLIKDNLEKGLQDLSNALKDAIN